MTKLHDHGTHSYSNLRGFPLIKASTFKLERHFLVIELQMSSLAFTDNHILRYFIYMQRSLNVTFPLGEKSNELILYWEKNLK